MDMRDRQLDEWISSAVHYKTTLSPQDKKRAWEKVSRRTAHQRMLPPLTTEAPPKRYLGAWLRAASRLAWTRMTDLMTDETNYQRAHQNRYVMRYGGPARDGRLVLQVVNPMGFNFLSSAI
jgi:hypothetical protein